MKHFISLAIWTVVIGAGIVWAFGEIALYIIAPFAVLILLEWIIRGIQFVYNYLVHGNQRTSSQGNRR